MEEKKSTFPYRTISLPNDLYEEIEKHIKGNRNYVSIAHFIRIAVIDKIESDRHPYFRLSPPPVTSERDKEIDVMLKDYVDEKFKTVFESYLEKKFMKLMKKSIRKNIKKEKKGKNNVHGFD